MLIIYLTTNAQEDPELFPVNDRNLGYIGYYLEDGKTNIVKPQFCSATYNINGNYIVSRADHEINENGRRSHQHIINTEKYGLLDSKGDFLIDFSDNYDFLTIDDELITVGRNNKYGIINKKKEILIPLEYEWLDIETLEIIIAQKGNYFGVISNANKIIIPIIYDKLDNFTKIKTSNNFYVMVLKNGKKGIIDKNNKFIVEIGKFDIQFITETLICIKKGKKFNLYKYDLKPIFSKDFKILTLEGVGEFREIYAEDEKYKYNFKIDGSLISKEKIEKQF